LPCPNSELSFDKFASVVCVQSRKNASSWLLHRSRKIWFSNEHQSWGASGPVRIDLDGKPPKNTRCYNFLLTSSNTHWYLWSFGQRSCSCLIRTWRPFHVVFLTGWYFGRHSSKLRLARAAGDVLSQLAFPAATCLFVHQYTSKLSNLIRRFLPQKIGILRKPRQIFPAVFARLPHEAHAICVRFFFPEKFLHHRSRWHAFEAFSLIEIQSNPVLQTVTWREPIGTSVQVSSAYENIVMLESCSWRWRYISQQCDVNSIISSWGEGFSSSDPTRHDIPWTWEIRQWNSSSALGKDFDVSGWNST
jgi:hypothetical protein